MQSDGLKPDRHHVHIDRMLKTASISSGTDSEARATATKACFRVLSRCAASCRVAGGPDSDIAGRSGHS